MYPPAALLIAKEATQRHSTLGCTYSTTRIPPALTCYILCLFRAFANLRIVIEAPNQLRKERILLIVLSRRRGSYASRNYSSQAFMKAISGQRNGRLIAKSTSTKEPNSKGGDQAQVTGRRLGLMAYDSLLMYANCAAKGQYVITSTRCIL